MYGGGWKGLIFVLISAHALFYLATATTCTSPSNLPSLFSPVSANILLAQVLHCKKWMVSYFNPSLVTTVAAQCLPYGKQGMCTQVQPTLILLVP